MYIGGRQDLAALDQFTIEQVGLPGAVLMENAGSAIVSAVLSTYHDLDARILVLAGNGNNGGDGFVAARKLCDHGYNVELCLLPKEETLKGDALTHFLVYKNRGLPYLTMATMDKDKLQSKINCATIIIDAMIGSGMQGIIKDPFRSVIEMVNESTAYVLAVDIPSGLEADTGLVTEMAIKADRTITFVMPKKGFFLQDGPMYIGEWEIADISVPYQLAEKSTQSLPRLITNGDVYAQLPKRPSNSHKGTFGHGIVIGGSSSYVGAPIYSAKAAFHSGIGLVTLAVPEENYTISASQLPEALYIKLSNKEDHISPASLSDISFSTYKAIAIGPGLSRFKHGGKILEILFSKCHDQPIIIDADGLFYLKDYLHLVKEYKGPVIITPHPGEMAALLECSVEEIESNRLEVAKQFAKEHGVYVLLKGHRSIVEVPDGNTWVNPHGHDALARGGSGDVLTGLILSFICQHASPEQALVCATFLHARAAEVKAEKLSHYSVTPNAIIEGIPEILNDMR